jgi:hypothetical protein
VGDQRVFRYTTHEIESQYDYWKRVATMGRHSRRMAVVDGLKGGV